MEIQFQIDPLASFLSLIALAVSWRALHVAKKEPANTARSTYRSELRSALDSGLDITNSVLYDLVDKTDISAPSPPVGSAISSLRQNQSRLPEQHELALLASRLDSATALWLSTWELQEKIKRASLRAGEDTTALEQELASSRDRLRTELRDFGDGAKKYIDRLDAEERAGRGLA